MVIKALTLTQPWATLVALGAKRIETRSWPLGYRGWLAIHAGKGLADMDDYDLRDLVQQEPFHTALAPALPCFEDTQILDWQALPRGAMVAVVRMVACRPVDEIKPVPYPERAFGNYASGRYAWLLENVIALPEPIPARGHQGVWPWEVPPALAARLQEVHP